MKPSRFDYLAPRTLDEALRALGEHGADAVLLAGGQSLVPLLNLRIVLPEVVIDLNRLEGLATIEPDEGGLQIGALTRLARLERDPDVARAIPVLREGLRYVAHPQIRNRSTLGGTISHADPTAEVPVIALAHDATFTLASARGQREVPADGFFRSVLVTAKDPDEMLIGARFPLHAGVSFRFGEIARRSHGDFPYVCLCSGLRANGEEVVEARLAAGGVAERPVRLRGAEAALVGRSLSEALPEAVAAALAEVAPPSDLHGSADFRRGLLRTLLRRQLSSIDRRTVMV